jgi:hypothetical protein
MSLLPRHMSTSSTTSYGSSTGRTSSHRPSRVGIGGAGNILFIDALPEAPFRPVISRVTGPFRVGIGGAGNSRAFEDRAMTLAEHEEREKTMLRRQSASATRFHGIGGAGNIVTESFSANSSISRISGADKLRMKVSAIFT